MPRKRTSAQEAEELRSTVQDLKDEVKDLRAMNKRLRFWNKQCEENMEKQKKQITKNLQETMNIVELNAKLQSRVREMREGMEAVTKEKNDLEHEKKVFIAAIDEIDTTMKGVFPEGENFGSFVQRIMKSRWNES